MVHVFGMYSACVRNFQLSIWTHFPLESVHNSKLIKLKNCELSEFRAAPEDQASFQIESFKTSEVADDESSSLFKFDPRCTWPKQL